MGEAIGDDVGTVILAGVSLGFPDGLLQRGDTGQILRVNDYIIEPFLAAVVGYGVVVAVYSGHGQRYEEGVYGAGDHFGNLGFYQQIQTYGQIGDSGVAHAVSQGHFLAAVCGNINLQSVLYSGGVCIQRVRQCLDQHIAGVVIFVCGELIAGVSGSVPVCAAAQADCCQQIGSSGFVEAV